MTQSIYCKGKKVVYALLLALAISPAAYAGDCNVLSGELRIGKTDGDYATIAEAIEALKCGGVNGPVTFLLEDGTYPDKLDLPSIRGASAKNIISFESAKGNNSGVIITSSSPDAGYTIGINGASYIRFENLTIENKTGNTGNTVRIDGPAKNITLKNVVLNGNEKPTTGANSAVIYSNSNEPKTNISIEDCEINNGSTGLYKGGAASADTKTSIAGTLFFNQYESAITLTNESAPVITNNVISTVSIYKNYKGIALNKVNDNSIISGNVINAVNGSYGLYLQDCEGTAEKYASVSNNAINVGGESNMFGIYLAGTSDNLVFNFNRVKITPVGKLASNQGYYRNAGSGANINLLNDIFFDLNTGGYTIVGNTYKDLFNQLPSQSNPSLNMSSNGIVIEKVMPAK